MSPATPEDRITDREGAEAEWAALAPLLASQPRVRLSRDGGRTYKDSGERDLTGALPSVPAAVRTCGRDGLVRTICLDLDVSRGGQERVDADYRALQAWFAGHGVRWIEDTSPSGGRHLYVPFKHFGVAFHDAKDFVQAAARRFTSIDAGPHENAKTGAIRVPGSVWKRGGYQRLTMSLNTAFDVAKRGNDWKSWTALRGDLTEELGQVSQRRTQPLRLIEDTEFLPLETGARILPAAKEKMARSGDFDTAAYASPSEARQAVLASAAAAGWTLANVQRLMHQNTWAGMNGFYARYRPQARAKALYKDWLKAVGYVAGLRQNSKAPGPGNNHDRKSYTSPLNTHPPALSFLPQPRSAAEYQYLKTWQNALAVHEDTLAGSRAGLGERMLLRALGEAANKAGSRFIEFGVRSLALATGTHETTVARQLRGLARHPEAMIRLAAEGRGQRGDLYELVIPEQYRDSAGTRAWKAGKIHALRPVFRELGVTAAFVYETVETSPAPLSSAELARTSALSPSAVNEALFLMAAWNMIERIDGRWRIVRTTSLATLAEHFGVLEAVRAQHGRYRLERAKWHQWLAKRALSAQPVLAGPGEDYPWERAFYTDDELLDEEQTLVGWMYRPMAS